MDRFDSCSDSNIQLFIEHSKTKNTSKSTDLWMRVYHSWAETRDAPSSIETLAPVDLDQILQTFYAEIKKKNGDDYEPNSLSNMQSAIDRYLKEKQYKFSIIRDREFTTSRAVLEGKARILRENGKGKRPNKASSLTSEEEEILWTCGQLGSYNPRSLINTIWWQFTQHFGLHGRQEHHSMKVEDFIFKKDNDGKEYLTFAEGITKTRQSGLHEKHRLVIPKMFVTGTPRCPVSFFKLYLSKRPINLRQVGPLYLTPIPNPISALLWYKSLPMGQNTINNLMKSMASNSPLQQSTSKKITNHSARKTLVKKLKSNNVPKSEIIGITGHNSEAGLDAYDSGDENQQCVISNAIDNNNKSSSSSMTNWIVPFNDKNLMNPTFTLVDQKLLSSPQTSSFNFNNCNVNFYNYRPESVTAPPPAKRRRILYSSDSSQE